MNGRGLESVPRELVVRLAGHHLGGRVQLGISSEQAANRLSSRHDHGRLSQDRISLSSSRRLLVPNGMNVDLPVLRVIADKHFTAAMLQQTTLLQRHVQLQISHSVRLPKMPNDRGHVLYPAMREVLQTQRTCARIFSVSGIRLKA